MLHLKSAQLSGYRSIKQAKVEFRPGLNIIIGKNAVGKTNFLSFLYRLLRFEYSEFYDNFTSDLILEHGNGFEVDVFATTVQDQKNTADGIASVRIGEVRQEVRQFGVTLTPEDVEKSAAWTGSEFPKNAIDFECILISHGIPHKLLLVDKPISFSISTVNSAFPFTKSLDIPFFIKCLITHLFNHAGKSSDSNNSIREAVRTASEGILLLFKGSVSAVTSISDVRISDDYRLSINEEDSKVVVSNVYLEYHVDGVWYTFSQLSTGTQRLFLLVSDLTIGGKFSFTSTSISEYLESVHPQIILIEEPELGIHPHQLHKLMQLIRDESEKKQIILTTHSPQVLDILEPDDLDRIIIAKHDRTKGTTFDHLSAAQRKKAKKYMSDVGFLSDYWRFSDLEN